MAEEIQIPGAGSTAKIRNPVAVAVLAIVTLGIYILFYWLGLLNAYGALVLPFAISVFGIFLMRQFFLGVPDDLIDAARIDGMSEYGIVWSVGRAVAVSSERVRRVHDERDAHAAEAVAEERERIARELHDVVSHALSVMILQARGGRRLLNDDPEETRGALDVIEHAGEQALGEMRPRCFVNDVARAECRSSEPEPQREAECDSGVKKCIAALHHDGL